MNNDGEPQFGIRLQHLKEMDYKDYLKTPEWRGTRLKSLSRAKYQCQHCNNNDNLNVHHKTYQRLGEEYDTDLVVLCRKCHELQHE